ncbi:MAG: LamB/YcsF family protein, partial [Agromyces sp.]|nr:LamB/YcsF family protein [Agromyces sp.]
MRPAIDLNSDLGESFGAWRVGDDEAMFGVVTSANIACGYHAGDPLTMSSSVRLAIQHGVVLGAHPGYRDRVGFGRRALDT